MTLRSLASLVLLAPLACSPESKDDSTATDTAGDSTDATGTETGGDTTTGASGDTTMDAETVAPQPSPEATEVCTASCDKFKSCADDPAMFDSAECISDCEALIVFLGHNNPGTHCPDTELNRQDCLSKATCEEIDAYVSPDDPPNQVCQEWDEKLGECAIE
ncbi:hypothetical protein SAMN02745121_07396 [Nannocystis exedens]|uniref:Uncharacterized protein n=1 Tax=Nannocystis exedens TaxID=54 RepID=A0A1I2GM64_9BACT|nr:hypothetical protein [Nannocystis exedens]PCC73647.1 hypothetical protein NAEX_06735 [Nannocystis exedens]SFF18338.1 hypothetical protein SAMN02745121_07396 [Nannocystis exedens]